MADSNKLKYAKKNNILALEPFYGESHKEFLDHLSDYSQFDFKILGQPASLWKWRVQSSPYVFSDMLQNDNEKYSLLFLSDFIDLPSFLGATNGRFAKTERIIYFHENQITYPEKLGSKKDFHYGYLNLTSAVLANEIWFNSNWHKEDFFNGAEKFLKILPKQKFIDLDKIESRSKVVYLGVEFPVVTKKKKNGPLHILWNHRWEFDKNPEDFFRVIENLNQKGLDFKISVCGKSYKNKPEIFNKMQIKLKNRIENFGWIEDQSKYYNLISSCDVSVSTAIHEFFGISVVESIALGCFPLLPNRLSYPELISYKHHEKSIYSSLEDLENKLEAAILNPESVRDIDLSGEIEKFKWKNRILEFDELFSECLKPK